MKPPELTIVVPFLNEQDCLPGFVAEMNRFLPANFPGTAVEVLFVNDGSTDRSPLILREQKFVGYRARLVNLSRNFGSHAALRAGVVHAHASVVSFLMADLQDPPEIIPAMFAQISKGFEVVWARRPTRAGLAPGQIFSVLYALLMQKFALSNYPKAGCDVVMFGPKAKAELNERIEGNSSVFLQLLGMGFDQTSIDYRRRQRTGGRSKWTFGKKIKLFVDSFVAFSYMPIRMVSLAGILVSLLGFAWLGILVVEYFYFGSVVRGWTALVAALMIGFGTTNISLGIIAEYLWRTLDAARDRKVFIVKDDLPLGGGET